MRKVKKKVGKSTMWESTMEVTKEIIELVADYCNYEYEEVELWSDENIINAYYNVLKEIERYGE